MIHWFICFRFVAILQSGNQVSESEVDVQCHEVPAIQAVNACRSSIDLGDKCVYMTRKPTKAIPYESIGAFITVDVDPMHKAFGH
jgi:hypothetical protein